MSLNSFSNSISWWLTKGSRSTLILTCYRFSSEPKLILVNCSSSMIVHPAMRSFWTLIWTSVSLISIYPTSGWKNLSSKCCWKILGVITILISHTGIGLTSISDETCGLDTSSTSLLTYSKKLKPTDIINLIGWFD